MHITTRRAVSRPERIAHVTPADHPAAPRRGPETSGLTPEEIREIVLEILG